MVYQLSKGEKKSLSFLIIFLSIYLYLSFFLFPRTGEMKRINETLKKYQGISSKSIADKDQVKLNKNSILPDKEKPTEIAYNLKVYADKCDIKLLAISFGESGTFNNSEVVIKYVPIHISFTGNNNNRIKYLNMIENDKRMCEINDISTNYSDSANGEASANIKYYYLGKN